MLDRVVLKNWLDLSAPFMNHVDPTAHDTWTELLTVLNGVRIIPQLKNRVALFNLPSTQNRVTSF
jgi:hypothetical protein